MKHTMKLVWIIAFVAIIGFAMASCGGGGGGGTDGGSPTTGLSGTYTHESEWGTIRFSGSTFSVTSPFGNASGNFTVTGGTTVTLTTTQANDGSEGEVNVWTIVNDTTLLDEKGEYWRK